MFLLNIYSLRKVVMEPGPPTPLKSLASHFEEALRSETEKLSLEGRLREAVLYALLSGGKRIRPLFALALSSDIAGNVREDLFRFFVPLEMVHAASLVHDDLPALDNDDTRRGQPSLHKAFDEATAILCGDYLVPAAFGICGALENGVGARLTQALARAYSSVCFGQQLDLAPEISAADLIAVHRNKTAALFAGAAEFAGILSNQTPEQIKLLSSCGEALGMYFQFADDFLDRDDEGPNLTRGLSLEDALQALDQSYLRVEQSIVAIEAFSQQSSLKLTREIVASVKAQLASG